MDQFLCVAFARVLIHQASATFITRAKSNTQYRRLYSRRVDKRTGLRCDQTILLTGIQSDKDYPEQLRDRRAYRRAALQMPLEGRTVFPLDQTAPAHQSFSENIAQRRQVSGLDCKHLQKLGSSGIIVDKDQAFRDKTRLRSDSSRTL